MFTKISIETSLLDSVYQCPPTQTQIKYMYNRGEHEVLCIQETQDLSYIPTSFICGLDVSCVGTNLY